MSKEAEEFRALVLQIAQLRDILSRRPNPQAERRLAECTKEYDQRKGQLVGSLAERVVEKETLPAEKRAPKPQNPAPSVPVPRSSVAPPTKREQQLVKAQRRCEQAERAAREARISLNSLTGQRQLLPRGRFYDEDRQRLDKSIANASQNIKTNDDLVLAAKQRAAQVEESVSQAKAKAQQLREAQEHDKPAEQSSTTVHERVDDPSHELESDKRAESVQQPEGSHVEMDDTMELGGGNDDDHLGWEQAFTPITAKKPAPVISKPAHETGFTSPEDLREKDLVDLEGDDISFPIAALIVGILAEGVYGIGIMPDSLQMTSRYGWTSDVACLTSPDKMIIPLMLEISDQFPDCGTESYDGHVVEAVQKAPVQLSPEEIERRKSTGEWVGPTGHWLLVIATRSNTGGLVDLSFLNSVGYTSGPGYDASRNVLRRIARNIVRHSGWMGAITPSWGQEVFKIPQVQRMGNTCGTHVVVNAWADILGLQLDETNDWGRDESLYRGARVLMIRATAGDASARDIEAWLVGHHKVKEREHEPAVGSELAAILRAQTVAMKGGILSDFIDGANLEAAARASHINDSGANPSTDVSNPVSSVPTATANTSTTKPTTANTPVVDASIPPAPITTPSWRSRGYAVNTSDEEDSTASTGNVSKAKPTRKPTPKPTAQGSTTKSTAAKTSLPKASGQPELRRSGRTRKTVSRPLGFVSSLEIQEVEASVVSAKRKAADSDHESIHDSDVETRHDSQESGDDSQESGDDSQESGDGDGDSDSSSDSDNDNDNANDNANANAAVNNVEPGTIPAAAKSQHTTQETSELRFQVFGLLEMAKLRELARKGGLDQKFCGTRDPSSLWRALAFSDVAVPRANLEAAQKMRYKVEDLESVKPFHLRLETLRLRLSLPKYSRRDDIVQRLKEYAQGTAGRVQKALVRPRTYVSRTAGAELSEHKRLQARATELGILLRFRQKDGSEKMFTSEQLRESIRQAEEREQERLLLGVDDRLPKIQVTRPFKLVFLIFRYTQWKGNQAQDQRNKLYLQSVEEALRQGRILANLEDAEYQHIIYYQKAARLPMPFESSKAQGVGMTTSILDLQRNAGKDNAEVVIVLCGVDGLSVNGPSYRPFVEDHKGVKMTLLIGENLDQWTRAGVLWADADWSPEELERRWAAIDLGVLVENPGVCRLYTDLLAQWVLCAGSREARADAIRSDPRSAVGRGAPGVGKRQKK
ncbi:MAG: hypothetical protein LQ349_005654 [Xanthoria aureola]|nr:MAG: hypothetical protein LQ349_005654 [Xanthoria aureola]